MCQLYFSFWEQTISARQVSWLYCGWTGELNLFTISQNCFSTVLVLILLVVVHGMKPKVCCLPVSSIPDPLIQTHTRTHTHSDTFLHTNTYTHSCTLSHTLGHSDTQAQSHAYTHPPSDTLRITHTPAHMYTHADAWTHRCVCDCECVSECAWVHVSVCGHTVEKRDWQLHS